MDSYDDRVVIMAEENGGQQSHENPGVREVCAVILRASAAISQIDAKKELEKSDELHRRTLVDAIDECLQVLLAFCKSEHTTAFSNVIAFPLVQLLPHSLPDANPLCLPSNIHLKIFSLLHQIIECEENFLSNPDRGIDILNR